MLSFNIYNLESRSRKYKEDLIEISDIKYGLFNVDKWKDQVSVIITKKIEELELSGDDKEKARKKITKFLYKAVDNFEGNYKENNKKKALFGLSIKNLGAEFFSIFEEFRNNIPKITEQILSFLEKDENRDKIKEYILGQLDSYADSTFQKIDYTVFNGVLKKYSVSSDTELKDILNQKINAIDKNIKSKIFMLLPCILLVFVIIIFNRSYSKPILVLYIIIAFVFLVLGLLLPMIDIDARIGAMEFSLLGEKILFEDQVLFYKSKSILEMAEIMLSQQKLNIVLVGVLVLVLSVVFPVFKLISSLLLIAKESLINNKVIKFMVFKSGKWSMADVMVVAIFMSYIGFSGILGSQMSQLEQISDSVSIMTTDKSELQNGFYFFITFVLLSISVSQILANKYEASNETLSNSEKE